MAFLTKTKRYSLSTDAPTTPVTGEGSSTTFTTPPASTTPDNVTLEINPSGQLAVKDGGITDDQLDASIQALNDVDDWPGSGTEAWGHAVKVAGVWSLTWTDLPPGPPLTQLPMDVQAITATGPILDTTTLAAITAIATPGYVLTMPPTSGAGAYPPSVLLHINDETGLLTTAGAGTVVTLTCAGADVFETIPPAVAPTTFVMDQPLQKTTWYHRGTGIWFQL